MQNLIFFDTETTSCFAARGNIPGGEVIQIACIIVDAEFNIQRIINRYCQTKKPITPEAENIHGISAKKLAILSEGKSFETVIQEEGLRDFNNVTWVAYNIGFDVRMIRQTSVQNGYAPIDFGSSVTGLDFNRTGIYRYDAMNPLTSIHRANHRISLKELVDAHIGQERFEKICLRIKTKYNLADNESNQGYFHNAVFDTVGLLFLINKYKNLVLV